ncbi:hypothetical protein [Burkholderia gladioli]|uniref:hypothetical protein n=1 Tax=Burkholderia gladioli TaxID=28095 RepID=UPI0012FB82E8|nr:hypothetical protein [Burkholderia gladioli]
MNMDDESPPASHNAQTANDDSHDLPIQAMLRLIIANPGIDSLSISRQLAIARSFVSTRIQTYIHNGMVRIEKREIRGKVSNTYYAQSSLIEEFPNMKFSVYPKRRLWSEEEIAILKRDYAIRDTVDLAREVGTSINGVRLMAQKFGLSKSKEYMVEVSRKGAAAYNALPVELRNVIKITALLRRKIDEQQH